MGSRREQKAPTSGRTEEQGQGGKRTRRGAEVHPGPPPLPWLSRMLHPCAVASSQVGSATNRARHDPLSPRLHTCPLMFPDSNSTREPNRSSSSSHLPGHTLWPSEVNAPGSELQPAVGKGQGHVVQQSCSFRRSWDEKGENISLEGAMDWQTPSGTLMKCHRSTTSQRNPFSSSAPVTFQDSLSPYH